MNRAGRTVYPILLMVCATHLLNDMMQSVIPAVYPLLKEKFGFTFAQIGLITLVFFCNLSPGGWPTSIRGPIRWPRGCVSRCADCLRSPPLPASP